MYSYRCQCGEVLSTSRHPTIVCSAGHIARRVFSFYSPPPKTQFQPHFNHSVGEFVQSKRDFLDKLNRKADIQTEALGYEQKYSMIEPGDVSPPEPVDPPKPQPKEHSNDR